MRKLLFAILPFAAGLAWAETGEETGAGIEALQIRLATIEQIDVTAEKTPLDSAASLDAEIDAILEEADALEEAAE